MSAPEGRCSVETNHADIAVSLRNRLVQSNSMELQAKLLAGVGIVKGCKKGEKVAVNCAMLETLDFKL